MLLRTTLLPRCLRARRISTAVHVAIADPPAGRATGDVDGDADRLAAAAKDMLHVDTDEAARQAKETVHDVGQGLQDAVHDIKASVERAASTVSHAAHDVASGEMLHRATDAIKDAYKRATHIPEDIENTLHDMSNKRPDKEGDA